MGIFICRAAPRAHAPRNSILYIPYDFLKIGPNIAYKYICRVKK